MIDLPPTHGVVLCLVCLQGQGTLPLEQAPFAVIKPHAVEMASDEHLDGPQFEPVRCPGSGARLVVMAGGGA